MATILATRNKSISVLSSLFFLFPHSEALGQILLLKTQVQLHFLLQGCAFGKDETTWPIGLTVQYPSILLDWERSDNFQDGKMPLMNKPAHASTQSRKWTGTEPKPAEVLTHWQVSRDSPVPVGCRQTALWQVMLVTEGEQGRSPLLCLLPRALPSTSWASRRDVCLSGSGAGQPAPSWNTLSQHLPFSSHNHSVSRRWSCQELSSCTFSPAKARQLAHLPKKQAEEGFWRRKRNRRTTQDADVNQNWERRWMWRLFGSQLQLRLLLYHFPPVIPELLLCTPDLHHLSCTKVSAPLLLFSPYFSIGSLLLVLPTWLLMSELL